MKKTKEMMIKLKKEYLSIRISIMKAIITKAVYIITFSFLFLITFKIQAQNSQSNIKSNEVSIFQVRPNVNFGFYKNDFIYSYGIRALLIATEGKKFGLEFSRFENPSNNNDFYTIGIILEQTSFGWLHTSIGTIGYFNYGENSENLIGLVTNVGWEPQSDKLISPFITLRKDFIFANKLESLYLINIGFNINF